MIRSPHNDRVAAARRLRERKGRLEVGATLAEGPHAIELALDSGAVLRELFCTAEFAERHPDLVGRAVSVGAELRPSTAEVVAKLSDTRTPQGAVATVAIPSATLESVLAGRPRLVVVLVGVADPGNAGTVIRTADAAGAEAVVVTAGSADVWAGKVIRASAGSVFALPVVSGQAIGPTIQLLQGAALAVLATAADGPDDLDDLVDAGALDGPTAWVLGSEAHGLDPAVAVRCDRRVRIALRGRAESLNLAAAAAVCLFASASAHRRPGRADLG